MTTVSQAVDSVRAHRDDPPFVDSVVHRLKGREYLTLEAQLLARLRARSAVPAMMERLHDPATWKSSGRALIFALGDIGDPRAIPEIEDVQSRLQSGFRPRYAWGAPMLNDEQVADILRAAAVVLSKLRSG